MIKQGLSTPSELNSLEQKQVIVEDWLVDILVDKLRKASTILSSKEVPFILYRNIIEENDTCVQEEVATLTDKYVVIQVFSYGGFIPSTFQRQHVFTIEKFTRGILKKNNALFYQCLENLKAALVS
ncbi:MAG TPA: hypothetical protein VJ729_03600 [Nitrososphaeraceae archaeon]|nr:hypothetical protein [Nitrososphaeraceae archaeon]